MSHWIKGKIALGCSIDILQKALIKIRSDWKNHIEVSEKQELSIKGKTEKYNIVLRNVGQGSYGSPDIGFTKRVDGTWEMDSYDFYEISNLNGKIKQTVAEMRYQAMAEMQNGAEIIESGMKGKKKRMVLRTPVTREYVYDA